MSMNRNDALHQLALGLIQFEGQTAGQFLESGWAGINGLNSADLTFFKERASLPVQQVASACQNRSRYSDGGVPATDAQVVLRVPAVLKNKWVKASQADGKKLTEWLVAKIEGQQ